jgi:hypothetical protein
VAAGVAAEAVGVAVAPVADAAPVAEQERAGPPDQAPDKEEVRAEWEARGPARVRGESASAAPVTLRYPTRWASPALTETALNAETG